MNRAGFMGLLCAACVACGSDADTPPVSKGSDEVEASVDRRGAVLELERAARLTVPADALGEETTLRARKLADATSLPRVGSNFEVVGAPLEVTPHGLKLQRAATIEQVIDDPDVGVEELRVLRLANDDDDDWERVPGELRVLEPEERTDGRDLQDEEAPFEQQRRVRFDVDGFSYFLPVRVVNGPCTGRDAGEVCRPAAGPCDAPEVCDGESAACPDDAKLGAEQVCRQSTGACDLAESCDGESDACPPDALSRAGDVCRPGNGACDVAELCDGESPTCPADGFEPGGEICAEATACLRASSCTGDSPACPVARPLRAGTACDDAQFCTLSSSCDGQGNCVGSGDPCQANVGDPDADCSESCVELAGGFECTGDDPAGSQCAPQACAIGVCDGSGSCDSQVPCPVFVDYETGSDQAGCGASWATACASVQFGSDVARDADPPNPRVFVKGGADSLYTTASGTVLSMADGIAYYGGFVNETQQRPEDRSLAPADYSTLQAPASSSSPVVLGASDARLDGFEVTGGLATDGAGMRNDGVRNLTLSHVAFVGNLASGAGSDYGRGGALYNTGVEDLRIDNAQFTNNVARGTFAFPGLGGAIYNAGTANVTVVDTDFFGNQAQATNSARGGAIYSDNGDRLRIQRCDFEQNIASSDSGARGGAVANLGSTATLVDVRFDDNRALGYGVASGGALHDEDSNSELTRVWFSNNRVPLLDGGPGAARGGAYSVKGSGVTTTLSSVAFVDNLAYGSSSASGAGLFASLDASSSLTMDDASFVANLLRGNGSVRGGGAYLGGASAVLTGVQFKDNEADGNAGGFGAGVFRSGGSLEVRDADFIGQQAYAGFTAPSAGAGLLHQGPAPLTLTNVGFVNNIARDPGSSGATASASGAGVQVENGADYVFTNLSFVGNRLRPSLGGGDTPNSYHATSAAGLGQAYNTASDSSPSGAAPGVDTAPCSLLGSDYTLSADRHVYLTAAGATKCNSGSDSQANAAFASVDWRTLTTRLDGTLDTSPVNQGRHYDPSDLRIFAFGQGATVDAVTWQLQAPAGTRCSLTDEATTREVTGNELASGGASGLTRNSQPSLLRCWVGGTVVEASAPVALP